MFYKKGLCSSYFILACSIVISGWLAFWLYTDTDLTKYIDFSSDSRKLLLYKRYEDNLKLRSETIASIIDDDIDIIWLRFITNEDDGYAKLQLYLRLLAGNPDYEVIYRDIALTMDSATEEFKIKEKPGYLKELMAVKGVHHILLERYGLLDTRVISKEEKAEL